jgi:hypothetical protein
MTPEQVHKYVDALKTLFAHGSLPTRARALTALVNFTTTCRPARVEALGARNDIVSILEEAGIDDPVMNVKYAALINNISNEENCCIRLIEAGALKLTVSLQDSFFKQGFVGATAAPAKKGVVRVAEAIDGNMGQNLSASIFHNLSLKRAIIGPGMLTSFLNLIRNTKSLRVLHCVRAFANMSVHAKSRIALAKERRLIPILSAVMRYGCLEADKVQHYSYVARFFVCSSFLRSFVSFVSSFLIRMHASIHLVCHLVRSTLLYFFHSAVESSDQPRPPALMCVCLWVRFNLFRVARLFVAAAMPCCVMPC